MRAVNVTCVTAAKHTKLGCKQICRLKAHAKRADERLDLADLHRTTKAIARTLVALFAPIA